MNRYFRLFMLFMCAVQAVMGVGFFLGVPAVTQLWPFSYTNQMSYIFISSIFAAAAASTLWCLLKQEDRALAGVALDYVAIFIPVSVYLFQTSSASANRPLPPFLIVTGMSVIFGFGLFLWARRQPIRDTRPMPHMLRWIFAFFVIALIIAGGRMVLKEPNVLPWTSTAAATVVYGWMFLGAASYFLYGVLFPGWYNTGGQLAGFLAYDLVLIVPVLGLYQNAAEARLPSLIIYTLVLVISGLLAIYYLFINPATRMRWPGPAPVN